MYTYNQIAQLTNLGSVQNSNKVLFGVNNVKPVFFHFFFFFIFFNFFSLSVSLWRTYLFLSRFVSLLCLRSTLRLLFFLTLLTTTEKLLTRAEFEFEFYDVLNLNLFSKLDYIKKNEKIIRIHVLQTKL